MNKEIINVFPASNAHMENLPTWRALPSFGLAHLDPFLLINHHGPATYEAHNPGLPFGPHPHRGFETLTYVFKGEVYHRDSHGGEGVIKPGGVQWMTAGRGIIHTEISPKEFQEKGGEIHIVQVWMNLPSQLKMTQPSYQDIQEDRIVKIEKNNSVLHLISGEYDGIKGPAKSITGLFMSWLEIRTGGHFEINIPDENNVMFYVVEGNVDVNDFNATTHKIAQFDRKAGSITIDAKEDSLILLGYGKPYGEPIVAQGPFVMNSDTQILEAMRDYRMGKMGVWID